VEGYPYDFSWTLHVPEKEPKKLAELKTLDEMPSPTPIITSHIGEDGDVIQVIPVHGLGVVTLRASASDPDTGRLTFNGMGLFTSEEIRPAIRSEKGR
jgi:hypothetical protein